jgi:hypothetical protein
VVTARDGAEDLRPELAQQVPDAGGHRLRRHIWSGGALITWRTSIGMVNG